MEDEETKRAETEMEKATVAARDRDTMMELDSSTESD
jgi:hypothetical protein